MRVQISRFQVVFKLISLHKFVTNKKPALATALALGRVATLYLSLPYVSLL